VQTVVLLLILRRFASRLALEVGVELINGQFAGSQAEPKPAEIVAQRIQVDEPAVPRGRGAGPLDAEPAVPRGRGAGPLDEDLADAGLGPSYADEQHAQEDAKTRLEQAVLRQVFEENMRLREQIDNLDGDAA
jgi:hypothetical protein